MVPLCKHLSDMQVYVLTRSQREGSNPDGFMSRTLVGVQTLRSSFYKPNSTRENRRWDVVLLGTLSSCSQCSSHALTTCSQAA